MKEIKTNHGKTLFIDCMDKNVGLPSIPAKSIELCFTDPPYNLGFDNSMQQDISRKRKGKEISRVPVKQYNDSIPEYETWSIQWFNEIKRICKWNIFTCGTKNLKMWLNIEEPTEVQIHYKPNCASFTHISRFNTYEPVLVYGKYPPFTFKCTAMNIPLDTGFLRKNDNIQHSSPKSTKLWDYYVKRSKPKTIIDPFSGSGTTQLIAESLGIPYICYEINEEFYSDIEMRVNEGIKIRKATGKIKKLRSYGN